MLVVYFGFESKAQFVNYLLIRSVNFSSQENYNNKGNEKGGKSGVFN